MNVLSLSEKPQKGCKKTPTISSTKVPNSIVVKSEVFRDLHSEIVPAEHTEIKASAAIDGELRGIIELEWLWIVRVAERALNIFRREGA